MGRKLTVVGRLETASVELQSQVPEIIEHDTWELAALRRNFASWARFAPLVEAHGTDEDRVEFWRAAGNAKDLYKRNEREDQRNRELIAVVTGGGDDDEPDGVA